MSAATSVRRRRFRWVALGWIGVLYVASIPWYRETGAVPDLIFGLPDWVVVAIGCYLGVAIVNALAWLATEIPDSLERDDSEGTDEP